MSHQRIDTLLTPHPHPPYPPTSPSHPYTWARTRSLTAHYSTRPTRTSPPRPLISPFTYLPTRSLNTILEIVHSAHTHTHTHIQLLRKHPPQTQAPIRPFICLCVWIILTPKSKSGMTALHASAVVRCSCLQHVVWGRD